MSFEAINELKKIEMRLIELGSKRPKEICILESAAKEIEKAFSGSWLGYHSNVYYDHFRPPPPGAVFSKEWGLMERFSSLGSKGNWIIADRDILKSDILKSAKISNIDEFSNQNMGFRLEFDSLQSEFKSIVQLYGVKNLDSLSEELCQKGERLEMLTANDIVAYYRPSGQQMSRDIDAINAGIWTPVHIEIIAIVGSIDQPFTQAFELVKIIKKICSHLEVRLRASLSKQRIGNNIFIGHGRSGQWRELKDYLKDRLKLSVDEFNRVPIAGITNIQRLQEMLDQSCMALLVMTAEDLVSEDVIRARQNVVHEVGLFQGRLGFNKAIVLLEDGCEEFSNIQGLGQIRFPAGLIKSVFEDVKLVLEREKIISI